jgi:hypothetical protein
MLLISPWSPTAHTILSLVLLDAVAHVRHQKTRDLLEVFHELPAERYSYSIWIALISNGTESRLFAEAAISCNLNTRVRAGTGYHHL